MNIRPGTFYAIGVGPGDPDLLTCKAVKILRRVDVLAYPVKNVSAAGLAMQIVERIVPAKTRRIRLLFPMRKDTGQLRRYWIRAARRIFSEVRLGRNVAFITQGDPMIYSTFIHIFQHFTPTTRPIPIVIVPGISSIQASAAATQIPLVIGDERMAILTGESSTSQIRYALRGFDTIVIMKISENLHRIIRLLEREKLTEKTVLVEKVEREGQEIIRNPSKLRGYRPNYLSLLIIRKKT